MRTSEQKHFRRRLAQGRKIKIECLLRKFSLKLSFLGKRDKERAGNAFDQERRLARMKPAPVGVAADRRACPDDRDTFCAGPHNGFDAGFDHPHDGESGKTSPQRFHRHGGGGIAGDEQRLDPFSREKCGVLPRKTDDRIHGFVAVGDARRVAQITDILIRQGVPQSAHDGQTADSGIENADGAVIRRKRFTWSFLRHRHSFPEA